MTGLEVENDHDPLEYADEATYEDGAPRVVLSRHGQWSVTAEGLEGDHHLHREFIPVADLSHLLDYDDPAPELEALARVSRKAWVNLEEFLEAYAEALIAHAGSYRPVSAGIFTRSARSARQARSWSERIENELVAKAAELGRSLSAEEEFDIMLGRPT